MQNKVNGYVNSNLLQKKQRTSLKQISSQDAKESIASLSRNQISSTRGPKPGYHNIPLDSPYPHFLQMSLGGSIYMRAPPPHKNILQYLIHFLTRC